MDVGAQKADLASLPIVTFIWSVGPGTDGFTWISPSAADLFGRDPTEICTDPRLIACSDDETAKWKMMRPDGTPEAVWNFDSFCEAKGARLWWRAIARHVETRGEITDYHGAIFDVSDIKAAELHGLRKMQIAEASLRRMTEHAERDSVALSDALECLDLLMVSDPSTGAMAWQPFVDAVRAESYRSRRYGTPMSIAQISIAGLDEIGMKEGQAAVDKLLSGTVAQVVASLRPIDRVGRLGESRFGLLLPCTHEAGALAVTERMVRTFRELIAELKLPEDMVDITSSTSEIGSDMAALDAALASLAKA